MRIKHDFIINKWSGGTTTELHIFPEGSNYKEKDFNFRLSTATVEIERSVFTPLESISRKLLVLDGEMTLKHEGHHEKTLRKFDVDEFEGSWTTYSKGKCVDFNLMLRNGTKGTVKGIEIGEGEEVEGEIFGSQFFVYLFDGKIEISTNGEVEELNTKELYALKASDVKKISVKGMMKSELVMVEIL